tara:strand:+ start:660 stop:1187 length:528 start_codon:yes stop_codon:yes gene_type:complete
MVDTPIVSDNLQNQFRSTFPSQISSGRDLHVSDVVVPIVDFTGQATSSLKDNLNNAIDFSMTDTGLVHDSTATVANTTGFFRVTGLVNQEDYVTQASSHFSINDGSTTKVVYTVGMSSDTNDTNTNSTLFDFIVYLTSGMTLSFTCSIYAWGRAHSRQIADVNGTATVPLNYTSS